VNWLLKLFITYLKTREKIIKTESEYELEHTSYLKNGWTENEIIKAINELKSNEKTAYIIDYYSNSLTKLNGISPVSSEFDIEQFYFSELEREQIEKGLK
jgi:hypothetical protein